MVVCICAVAKLGVENLHDSNMPCRLLKTSLRISHLNIQSKPWVIFAITNGITTICNAEELAKSATRPQEIVVTGSQTDTEARRDFIAGKIIIGRKRIDESGVQNVVELLKREPSVSIGKDGRIGLLGLPGYTQILVDGAPPPPGKGMTELDLIHVDKIEIIKSSMAELGPFGIAGTINIVTRKIERKTNTQLRVAANSVRGQPGADLAWSHNQSQADSPLSFNVQLSANKKTIPSYSDLIQTITPVGRIERALWQGQASANTDNSSLSASSSIGWKIDDRNKLTFSPSIAHIAMLRNSLDRRHWIDGKSLDARQQADTPMIAESHSLTWNFSQNEKSRLELTWISKHFNFKSETNRTESISGETLTVYRNKQERFLDSNFLKLDYKIGLPGGHDVKLGGHISRSQENGDYAYWINDHFDISLDAVGVHRQMREKEYRIFMQDDWRFNESLAFNFGLSGINNKIDLTEGSYRDQMNYRLWSPSIHMAKKIDGDDSRQIRVSLARSYLAPMGDQITLRPQINPFAPCAGNVLCAANTVDTADISGNPHLQAERSQGVNISYEHGIGNDSQLALELYARRIDSKVGTDITLENVPWSSTPRYVSRPTNLGNATVQGIDLEVQLASRDVWPNAPKVDLRGSIGVAHSQISSIPGPDNRLDKQSPWRAKLGASYAVKGLPLKFDIDANWAPGGWVRTSKTQRIFQDRTFSLGGSASWTINPDIRLFVNLDNLIAHKSQRVDEYINTAELIQQQSSSTTNTKLSVRLQVKL